MGDLEAQGLEYEQKAEKKLKGWGIFGSKYDDAADLLEKAGNSFKLAKAWDKAAQAYVKLANCHLKMESKHEAASAYVDAANCYKKTQPHEAVSALNTGVTLYMEIGRLSMAAKYLKDIAEIYGKEENAQKAMEYYEKAADLYSGEEANSTGNQCRLKVAEYAAELEEYAKAIEIYESVARQSLDSNLLKYSVKGYLLNAGLCHLCGSDSVAIGNALEKYNDLDPTFSNTREAKFLVDLAASVDEVDVGKFTDVVKEYDSMSRLDQWKTMLLLRAKNALKAKEVEEDELT
ncbi:unnamed protein product [Calypogeia fissa]